jgi:tetratricopeptide (TPR) repeat protein
MVFIKIISLEINIKNIKMNKLAYFLTFIMLTMSVGSKAQTATGTPVANYGILENKLKKSEANINDADKNIKPKVWISRAELMMDIFDVNRQFVVLGAAQAQIKLLYGTPLETKTWQAEGNSFEQEVYDRLNVTFKNGKVDSYEETKPIYDMPLPEAFKALEKAQELDVEKKENKDIKADYIRLKGLFERQAIEEYLKEKYNSAFQSFASILTINEKPVMEGAIDTIIFYNAGMAASKAGKVEEATKYYELARKYQHPEPYLYVLLKQKYFEAGDTAKGASILEEGFKRFPGNQAVLIELINYFLLKEESDAALNYLRIAQKDDSTNISFIFAEGTLYDKMGDIDKALASYQKCIDKDPKYFNAYYNIGVMYYNNAVKLYTAANSIVDAKEYEAAKQIADAELGKSVPYMEKAHEIDPVERTAMETLKTLYYRLQMTDKYKAIVKELSGE